MVLVDRFKELPKEKKIALSVFAAIILIGFIVFIVMIARRGYFATTMRLLRSEGTVRIEEANGNQKPVKLSDIKRRYNGDTFEERPLLSRLALHAYQLTVTHPVTNESITFTAPYSKDMEAVRNQLAKIFKVDPLA